MKEDERAFFKTCIKLINIIDAPKHNNIKLTPREIINTISEFMNYKRCWYLLEKWSNKGFYNYGVTMDLGWFEAKNFVGAYQEMYLEMLRKEGINI